MKPYILSLLGGLLAGAIYSLIRVRSPAPPMVALAGLLGMVIGAQIIPAERQLWRALRFSLQKQRWCRRTLPGELMLQRPLIVDAIGEGVQHG